MGGRMVVKEVADENECATTGQNWLEWYRTRDDDKNFIRLCNDYESGEFQWECHPKFISLRGFVSSFSKSWIPLEETKRFVPVFTPS